MNDILAPFLRVFVVVFIDDVLIYSKTWEEHLSHITQVFHVLQQHQFYVKLTKCSFAKQQLHYLGYVISSARVATDPRKVQIIASWPPPNCVKDLRSFLGMAGYYKKFVRHFGLLSKPLTNLLKKGELYVWTKDHQNSFEALKTTLITSPILALPNFTKPFTIETDASDKGIGAVLQQDGHPIAFVSKALGPMAHGLSTYEKGCMAILLAVDYWRPYLLQSEFTIMTDQKSHIHLDDQRLHTPWQHKALTKLLGLNYQIVHKKGKENKVADALSRIAHADIEELAAVSMIQPTWLADLQASYAQDPKSYQLL
jgi:hypothetical protein